MTSENLKHEIRRRMYAARVAAKQAPGELAAWFMTCPKCAGRKTFCTEYVQAGSFVASLDTCPRCDGQGFVDKS